MEKLKLKRESPAARCEVCHLDDLFEPTSGYCERCNNAPLMLQPSSSMDNLASSVTNGSDQTNQQVASQSAVNTAHKYKVVSLSIISMLMTFLLFAAYVFPGPIILVFSSLFIVFSLITGYMAGMSSVMGGANSNMTIGYKKNCPYCAETIQFHAVKCRFCNSWLTEK